MAAPAQLSPAVLEEAVDWLLKTQAGALPDSEAKAFERWLARSASHAQAWERATKLMDTLDSVSASAAIAVLNRPENAQRRAALAKLALLGAAVPTAWALWRYPPHPALFADYTTRVGDIKTVADGSTVVLNTDSAIDVSFSPAQRLIALQQGELHIETSRRTDDRPFLVQTAEGQLQALGTRFSVRQLPGRTQVAVFDGAVRIRARQAQAVVVDAGYQTSFSDTLIADLQPVDALSASWTTGMLMADALPLAALAAELNRYRRGRLRVEPALRELPVSGAYPLTDSDKTLNMLAATYPVAIDKALFGYVTTITAN